MKASAGAGKTFSLAREYMRLLFCEKENNAHRHILAVTFTNKATGEMKSRIIRELDILAHATASSDHRDYLMEHCGFKSEEELGKAADKALHEILCDYGCFSVSTIDRFFQQTLRAFAREAGQVCDYKVELDREMLVEEAVDRVLDSLSQDRMDLLKWLSDQSISSISDGESYKLEKELGDFALRYMSESFRAKKEAGGIDTGKAFSEDNIRLLKDKCDSIRKNFRTDFGAALDKLETCLDGQDGVISNMLTCLEKFDAFRKGDTEEIDFGNTTWRKACNDVSAVFKKNYSPDAGTQERVAAVDALSGRYRDFRTAILLRKQVSIFRTADALDKEFKAILAEKGVLSLEDTNTILRDIIGNTDAPFIYEKMGVRYRHFLIDEFQDTSLVQWNNFLPLLRNSIAEACYNLVVGDIKQSIYRWRNTDWKILGERVGSELSNPVENILKCNFRSKRNIVQFNNAFFSKLALEMDAQLGEGSTKIAGIYADVRQKEMKTGGAPGCVQISFCEGKEIVDRAVDAVKDAISRKFALKDIAVVVRTNAVGGRIAARLVAEGIGVVSNDSLLISSCRSVRALVGALSKIDNPQDRISSFFAPELCDAALEGCRSLTDLAENILRSFDAEQVNRDSLYVFAFMDLLGDFVSLKGNSLHAFLEYWKEEGVGKSISSPEGIDAVTIITIHKVKGLDYPFVVLPLPSKCLFNSGRNSSWECPDLSGSPFEDTGKALYDVAITESLAQTRFEECYRNERQMMYIDDINMWYVAFTRASQAMHIISPAPSRKILAYDGGVEWAEFKGINGALYQFSKWSGSEVAGLITQSDEGSFTFGPVSDREDMGGDRGKESAPTPVPLSYFPAGAAAALPHGRLRIKAESGRFFSDAVAESFSSSRRVRGIVLHSIMEKVFAPEDIPNAVRCAVMDGALDAEDAPGIEKMLSKAVEDVSSRGWFPGRGGRILDERSLMDDKGETWRPDRVVVTESGLDIIDYKFGAEDKAYLKQVCNYADIYRRLGYSNVRAHVWYVESGRIIEAS